MDNYLTMIGFVICEIHKESPLFHVGSKGMNWSIFKFHLHIIDINNLTLKEH